MKKNGVLATVIATIVGFSDSSFSLYDRFSNGVLDMTLRDLIDILSPLTFAMLIIWLIWKMIDYEKKMKALKLFNESRIEWIEMNASSKLEEVFQEIDLLGKALLKEGKLKTFSVDKDASRKPVIDKFHADLKKILVNYNEAFKNWGKYDMDIGEK